MTDKSLTIPKSVSVLAAGEFPGSDSALAKIRQADFLVCCDGAADKARTHGLSPQVIVGDLDSLEKYPDCPVIKLSRQDNTDLEKTLNWLAENGVNEITCFGVTGARDDHHLANLLILNRFATRLDITVITDYFSIHFITASIELATTPGQAVSLLTLAADCLVTTTGLQYPLKNELLDPGSLGVSNIAVGRQVTVSTSAPMLVFVAHD